MQLTSQYFLNGDSAYSLKSWLLKLFAHNSTLTSKSKVINYHLSRSWIVQKIPFTD